MIAEGDIVLTAVPSKIRRGHACVLVNQHLQCATRGEALSLKGIF